MGDFDYDEVQAKLHPPSSEKAEAVVEDDLGNFDMDDVVDVEPDTQEATEDNEWAEEPIAGEKLAKEEAAPRTPAPKAAPSPGQQPPATPAAIPDPLAKAVQDEVLRLVGNDAIIKIKGVERKLSDLSPEEIVLGIQKGIRADQIFNEMSGERKKLEEDRALVEKGATFIQQYIDRVQSGKGIGGETANPQLLALLKPTPEDTEETLYLKQNLAANIDRMSQYENQYRMTEHKNRMQGIANEVLGFKDEYPMASVDEVIAIKAARPNANTEDIMRAAHNYYCSEEHIVHAIMANPVFKREYEAEIIKNYLNKKQGAKKIPGMKSGSSNSEKVSERARSPISDFDSADAAAKAYLNELRKSG
jgi:hypothetical protein